jgi:hypothetical protein
VRPAATGSAARNRARRRYRRRRKEGRTPDRRRDLTYPLLCPRSSRRQRNHVQTDNGPPSTRRPLCDRRGTGRGEKPQVNALGPASRRRFRKPLLYPLSYEGVTGLAYPPSVSACCAALLPVVPGRVPSQALPPSPRRPRQTSVDLGAATSCPSVAFHCATFPLLPSATDHTHRSHP